MSDTKTALITGASHGIGHDLAQKLMRDNWRLMLVSRTKPKLGETNSQKNHTEYFKADLTRAGELNAVATKIAANAKSLDLLVNCAGIGIYKKLEEYTQKDWQHTLDLNLTAPFLLIKNLLPLLQNSNSPLVLNIGSGAGVIPMKNRCAYSASKFALRGLTLSLAEEFKSRQPFFCLITLGSTLTNFGGMTIEEKQKAQEKGRAYFPLEWVTNKLYDIINDPKKKTEYTLYPSEHGFGNWKKP